MSSRGSGPDRGLVAVTGCSSGIGQATAVALVDAGFRVLAGVRKLDDAAGLAQLGDWVEPIVLDVTNPGHVAAFGERVRSEPRGLAGLINNAGIISVGPVELVDQAKWEQVMQVNVLGTVAVTREAIPAILKRKGRIAIISSPSGRIALPMLGPYSVSKFGLEALADTLRRELGHSGVRVICISPGMVATPIFDKGIAEGAEFIDTNYANPDLYERYAERAFSAIDAGRDALEKGSTPDVAAALIVRAFTAKRPKARYGGGIENRAVGIVTKLPDRLLDWVVAQIATTEPR